MRRESFFTLALIVCFSFSTAAFAGKQNQVVQLQVDGMFSKACPVILRAAVKKLDGVRKVEASLENRSATIEFDRNRTSVKQIREIIRAKAGFKTRVKQQAPPRARKEQE